MASLGELHLGLGFTDGASIAFRFLSEDGCVGNARYGWAVGREKSQVLRQYLTQSHVRQLRSFEQRRRPPMNLATTDMR